MAENVFIFGAGASVQGGAPMMMDFIERAIDLSQKYREADPSYLSSVLDLLKARADLRKAQINSYLELDNIEDIFGAIEMANILGGIEPVKVDDFEVEHNFDGAIKESIIKTIEYSTLFSAVLAHPNNSIDSISAPSNYGRLISQIVTNTNEGLNETAFITFNYDLCLDKAIELDDTRGGNFSGYLKTRQVSYGFKDNGISVFKLHGSINWGMCPECGKITRVQGVQKRYNARQHSGNHYSYYCDIAYHHNEEIKSSKCNECGTSLEPCIVPPTWSKGNAGESIKNIWEKARTELLDARNVYIIGYSFPKSDSFFQFFFALSTMNNNSDIRTFRIFNPDDSKDTIDRFRKLAGPSLRNKFQYHPMKFESPSFSEKDGLLMSGNREYIDYWGEKRTLQ